MRKYYLVAIDSCDTRVNDRVLAVGSRKKCVEYMRQVPNPYVYMAYTVRLSERNEYIREGAEVLK